MALLPAVFMGRPPSLARIARVLCVRDSSAALTCTGSPYFLNKLFILWDENT
jgi:hypothetical protein